MYKISVRLNIAERTTEGNPESMKITTYARP